MSAASKTAGGGAFFAALGFAAHPATGVERLLAALFDAAVHYGGAALGLAAALVT